MRLSLIAPLFVAANTLFPSVLSSSILPNKNDNDNNRILEEDQVGIFLIKEIEDEQPNEEDEHNISEHTLYLQHGSTRKLKRRGRKRRTYNLAHDDGTISEITNGGRDWADNLISGRDKIRIPRGSIMSSGKDASINIMGRYPSRVREKDKKVEHHTHNRQPIYRNNIFDRRRNLAYFKGNEQLIGTKSILIVRIILNDGSKYERSQDDLRNDIFAPEGNGQVSLTSQYQACSYNKLNFTPSNVNNGVIDIEVNLSKADGHMAINNAVTDKINSQFNVNRPDKLADYVMYCHPKDTGVGLAYAWVNYYLSVYNDSWCSSLSAGMHELGHNMGLGHAGENDEYDDQVGFMGYSYNAFNTPVMCFNGAKSWQTGWYTDKTAVVNVGDCFEDNVYGISKYNDPISEVVLVKINDPSATDFYVSFNFKDGINSQTQEAGNRVTITSAAGEGSRSKYAVSTQLAKLFIGGQWSSIIGGKNMQVKVLSAHLGKGYARIRISENGEDCTTSSPTNRITSPPSPAPTKAPTPNPTVDPSKAPSKAPTQAPSPKPSSDPSTAPTESPSLAPSSTAPTLIPTSSPSQSPSKSPIKEPSSSPSKGVSRVIGAEPTSIPTSQFTSMSSSKEPSEAPSQAPTSVSTSNPSPSPSISPSNGPSKNPTLKPVTESPTQPVTDQPSSSPNKAPVTEQPTTSPSKVLVSSEPTSSPSELEVITPEPTDPPLTALPTTDPTQRSATDSPSSSPVESPSKEPTPEPTISPSLKPSKEPTAEPSQSPSKSPSSSPSNDPSRAPTPIPTVSPSPRPSEGPSNEPSLRRPTTQNPTSTSPSKSPTIQPTLKPSPSPTQRPVTAATPRPTRKIYSPGVRNRPTRNPTPLPTPQT